MVLKTSTRKTFLLLALALPLGSAGKVYAQNAPSTPPPVVTGGEPVPTGEVVTGGEPVPTGETISWPELIALVFFGTF